MFTDQMEHGVVFWDGSTSERNALCLPTYLEVFSSLKPCVPDMTPEDQPHRQFQQLNHQDELIYWNLVRCSIYSPSFVCLGTYMVQSLFKQGALKFETLAPLNIH